MKKILFVFITALLLVSCSHDKRQKTVVDEDWVPHHSIFPRDTSTRAEPKKDSVSSPKDKPKAVKSGSTGASRHTYKASDNMRGFDPASEDDMDDNGMSRYFDNNDEEGWD